jgi:hypothetical protein
MSVVFPGGHNITISPGQTQQWIFTWNDPGWQGITILQPQPLIERLWLDYSETTVTYNASPDFSNLGGTYSFTLNVTNNTNEIVEFNIQTSWFA